jgi:hypothetical protein
MRLLNTALLLILFFPSLAQLKIDVETVALNLIDKHLQVAGKSADYIISSFDELTSLSAKRDVDSFEKKRIEVDSVLSISGFFLSDHLHVGLLKYCLQRAYDLTTNKATISPTYHQLLEHLKYLNKRPEALWELSPQLHINTMETIIGKEKLSEPFYKVMMFLVAHGAMHEFYNLAQSQNEKNVIKKDKATINTDAVVITDLNWVAEQEANEEPAIISLNDDDEPLEVISIVVDDVEMDDDNSIKASACGDDLFYIVEQMPVYPGGEKALKKYLKLKSSGFRGTVYVQMVVDCTGAVTEAKVIKGLSPEADQLAIKRVSAMPRWTPGLQRNKEVRVLRICPVVFR